MWWTESLPIGTAWETSGLSLENRSGHAPIRIHADINAYAAIINPGGSLRFDVSPDRQAYLALIEGSASLAGSSGADISLSMRDASEITGESFDVTPKGEAPAHLLVIEMARC